MNALAPSMSHAMAALDNAPATWELCRADAGAGDVAAGQPAKKAGGDRAGMMEDCSYCLPHGGSVALMPSALTGMGLAGGQALRPLLFHRAPQPLLALSAAQPRGPPAFA